MKVYDSPEKFQEKLLKDYDSKNDKEGIKGRRLAERLYLLSKIGWTEDGGSRRMSFSKEEWDAKELLMKWMEEVGLKVRMDGAGNVFGRFEGKNPERVVMSGSHLDSVPNGGHFDGPLGVLAALEVASAWKESGYQPEKSFEVVCFTDEEGARFNGGMLGSQAFVGELDINEEKKRVDFDDEPFEKVLNQRGLTPEGFVGAKGELDEIDAFLEVHIEQGKRLEKKELPVGVVTGIAGPSWLNVRFIGEAGHAGNTPMDDRKDALVAASEFINKIKDFPPLISESGVATVGKLEVLPNGVNVIPGEVRLTVDVRDIRDDYKKDIVELIEQCAKDIEEGHQLEVEINESMSIAPLEISSEMQKKASEAVEETLGITPFKLPSGAGHDTMMLGKHVPVGLLFTRSKEGLSHTPKEWSSLSDCIKTVHVLKRMAEKLCEN
ncbi:Zn-dependent hydrolase [Halalkalibacillus sediminis]|uniref:Zn-dependent hydrolase n=1 Tax=Halalkalibacillus sediminis TaxID=2018042 RepID=A0A2I0QSC6_9BACI|nr:M20 family metallo-hydrolase [Halalkalibacillus sediminis]PKR77255.1 Zn-dependent hydrolase [Halalkalibacillus sediminis]